MSVTRDEWDEFWSRIWSAVWHTIGLLTVVITFIVISALIAYAVYDAFQTPNKSKAAPPTATSKSTQLSQLERQSLQSAFNILLANEKHPCAIKNKGERTSYVRNCSLFRVTLGMLDHQVTEILDRSGYFTYKSSLHDTCKNREDDCFYGRSVGNSRDGFYITTYFNYTNDSPTFPATTQITLRFDAGTHPYFEPETIRSIFVKVIGPPDYSEKDRDSWGKFWDGPNIEARISKDKEYSITLQDRSMRKTKKEADQIKKEKKN